MTEEEKSAWLKSLKVGDWVSLVRDDSGISVERQIVGEANTFWKLNCGQKADKLTGKALLD